MHTLIVTAEGSLQIYCFIYFIRIVYLRNRPTVDTGGGGGRYLSVPGRVEASRLDLGPTHPLVFSGNQGAVSPGGKSGGGVHESDLSFKSSILVAVKLYLHSPFAFMVHRRAVLPLFMMSGHVNMRPVGYDERIWNVNFGCGFA
jgi:hypothetical protein